MLQSTDVPSTGNGSRRKLSPETILERPLPHDNDSEVQVPGSIIARPQLIDDVAPLLAADDFFDTSHQRLYQCLLDMREKGEYCDIALLVARLKKSDDYEAIGGAIFLVRLRDAVATASHWIYHSRIVRENAARRRLIETGTNMIQAAYDDRAEPVADLIETARSSLEHISQWMVVRNAEDTTIRTVLTSTMDAIDQRMQGKLDFIRTGVHGLDRIMGGIRKKELTVIGARPSQGKSSLLVGMGIHIAMTQKFKTLLVSLEMSGKEIGERMLTGLSGVNGWKLRNGTMTLDDRAKIVASCGRLADAPLWIPEQSSMTVSQIAATVRYHQRRSGCDVVLIDYVQLIVPEGGSRSENRQQQIGKITRKLKQIAREMDVAIVIAAQVNRDNAKTASAPKLHNLREAGDIEADADTVIMCHMPGAYDLEKRPKNSEEGEEAELIIEKNRNGPTGQTEMWYRRAYARWEDKADNVSTLGMPPDQPRHSDFDTFNQAGSDSAADSGEVF